MHTIIYNFTLEDSQFTLVQLLLLGLTKQFAMKRKKHFTTSIYGISEMDTILHSGFKCSALICSYAEPKHTAIQNKLQRN
jgi:hypothetical protein